MKKHIIILSFLISYAVIGLNAKQQSIQADKTTDTEELGKEVKKQQQVIDSIKNQLISSRLEVEKAEKLISYSEAVYSKTKDSISMSDRIINLFIALAAFVATILGWSIIQSWRERKKFLNEAQQKIEELRKTNEEKLTDVTKALELRTAQKINELEKENEAQLERKKDELLKNSEQTIANISKSNEETVKSLISKHSKEQYLLEKSKILIINKSDTNRDDGLLMILERFKSELKIIDTLDFSDVNLEDLAQYDAVILDNINYTDESKNWDFNKEFADELLKIAQETCGNGNAFLFFGRKDGELSKKLPEYAHLINYANQSATLFANLIDLLDYRRILAQSKS